MLFLNIVNMGEYLIDGTGEGHKAKVSSENRLFVDVDSIYIQSGAAPFGYPQNETIRKDSGSPGVDFVFSQITNSVMIDNVGEAHIFFKFDGTADTGSTSGFIPAGEARSFDVQIGSINILGSGTGSPTVQCFRLS